MVQKILGFAAIIWRAVRRRPLVASLIALVIAFLLWPGLTDAQRALREARVWDYQLQNANLDRFAGSAADVIVMDYATTGKDARPYTKEEIDRVKRRPDGGKRIVLAYFSVGEAEEYRPYWNSEWKAAKPDWIIEENCRWPRNHIIKFWSDAWKDIIFRGKDAYLKRILAAGFDGVYLDRVDVYADLEAKFPEAKTGMLGFVSELAGTARTLKSDALIVVQNAEDLLDSWRYRWTIDAVAKEDLFYGVEGSGVRNEKSMVDWSLAQLKKLAGDGKPVFAVEYVTTPEMAAKVRAEIKTAGLVGTYPTRALDGRDPLDPAAAADAAKLKAEAGTPEFGAHCRAATASAAPAAKPVGAAPASGPTAAPELAPAPAPAPGAPSLSDAKP